MEEEGKKVVDEKFSGRERRNKEKLVARTDNQVVKGEGEGSRSGGVGGSVGGG